MKKVFLSWVSLLILIILSPYSILAQPASFAHTPTNLSGTLLGQITVGGAPAHASSWVAAFDQNGNCAGASQVIINGGMAYIVLPIYGNDITTTHIDEGMDSGESFSLALFDSSTQRILVHQSPCNPLQFSGWANSFGTPLPGYDDPTTVYDFADVSNPQAFFRNMPQICHLDSLLDLATFVSPEGGFFQGTGVSNNHFDPQLSGMGTFTLTYIYQDTSSCLSDTVTSQITILAAPSSPMITPTDTTICEGENVELIASGSQVSDFRWSNGFMGTSQNIDSTSQLTVTAIDSNGCKSLPSPVIHIQVDTLPQKPLIHLITGTDTLISGTRGSSFRWFFNGTEAQGQSGITYAPPGSGNIQVVVYNGDCPSDTSDTYGFIKTEVPIDELGTSLKIFPNPNTGSFWLQGDLRDPLHGVMNIYDSFGRLIYKNEFHYQSGAFKQQIILPGVSSGLYIVEFISPKGSLRVKMKVY